MVANSYDEVQSNERRKIADRARERSEHSQFRAIVAIVGIECIPDETAVTGPRAEQADLTLKLDRRRREQGDAQFNASIADREARREIVAPIDHQIMVGK